MKLRRTVVVVCLEDNCDDPRVEKWIDRVFDRVGVAKCSRCVEVSETATESEVRIAIADVADFLNDALCQE